MEINYDEIAKLTEIYKWDTEHWNTVKRHWLHYRDSIEEDSYLEADALYKVFWKDDRPNNHMVTIFHVWLKENVLDHYNLSLDDLPTLKDFLWSCQLGETDTPPNGRMAILAGLVSEKAIDICEYILNSIDWKRNKWEIPYYTHGILYMWSDNKKDRIVQLLQTNVPMRNRFIQWCYDNTIDDQLKEIICYLSEHRLSRHFRLLCE